MWTDGCGACTPPGRTGGRRRRRRRRRKEEEEEEEEEEEGSHIFTIGHLSPLPPSLSLSSLSAHHRLHDGRVLSEAVHGFTHSPQHLMTPRHCPGNWRERLGDWGITLQLTNTHT